MHLKLDKLQVPHRFAIGQRKSIVRQEDDHLGRGTKGGGGGMEQGGP